MNIVLPFQRRFGRDALIILAFSLFAWAPLLTPAYFFRAHDAPHSVFYLVEFDQTLRDGYLWPRWAPDFAFGYGYPLFNILAPLAIYAAEILHLLGLSFVAAIKTMYALSTVGAGFAMYLFARRLFGGNAGLLAAIVYMYVPFHLVEIFVRSAYSEFVALALLPLTLWAFTELLEPSQRFTEAVFRRIALAGLIYGILALTHITSLFTFTPFLVVYVTFLAVRVWRVAGRTLALRAALHTLASGLLGLALSAIYLLPMLTELHFVKVEQWTAYNYSYAQHFVYLSQLLSPDWGYGYSGPGLEDGMSFQLGAVTLVLIAFAGWQALRRRVPQRSTALFFLVATAVVVWLMSPAARIAWQVLPIASLVQFPWRLLGLTAVTMSVVAGSLLAWIDQNASAREDNIARGQEIRKSDTLGFDPPHPEFLVLLLVVALGSFGYVLPQYTPVESWREQPQAVTRWDRFSPADRVGMVAYTDEQPTTSPMEAQYLAGEQLQVATILQGTGTLMTMDHGGASDVVLVRASAPLTVQFYTYDYPGWQVTIDGRLTSHRHEPPYGLITVDVPAGEHLVSIRLGGTTPRRIGSATSIGCAVVIGLGLFGERIWRRRSNRVRLVGLR